MKILHAPRNTANQAAYVVRALRRMGHDAEVWEYGTWPFGFEVDRTIDTEQGNPRVLWKTFLEATERFDVLHFHAAQSLMPNMWGGLPPFWDLPIYRILGKKVFFTFHGSDCRIRRIHEQTNPWSYFKHSEIEADDEKTEKVIQVIRTFADRMFIVSIDYLDFIPDAEVVLRVIDLEEWPQQEPRQRDVPRIVHVPSRRGTKGSGYIVAGIEKLRDEGVKFDFQLLENVNYQDARVAVRNADIVVDNVLTGDYELVSMEAMASSRVAVANIQERVENAFPDAPVFTVDPDTFVERMRSLIADVDLRRSLAERGRAYVALHHDAPVIATRLLEFYEAPQAAVPVRAFPDWLSVQPARRIEVVEASLAASQANLMRARDRLARSEDARKRLAGELEKLHRHINESGLKAYLPTPLRLFLRRARARIRENLVARHAPGTSHD